MLNPHGNKKKQPDYELFLLRDIYSLKIALTSGDLLMIPRFIQKINKKRRSNRCGKNPSW